MNRGWFQALSIVLLVGCASGSKRSGAEANLLDNQVTSDRVKLALRAEKGVDLSGVRVRAENGTVHLSGSVASERAKQRAERAALTVSRVARVDNELSISQK